MAPVWLSIAKNEVRFWTSRFRGHRPLLFTLIALFMGVYAFFLVPLILNTVRTPIYDLLTAMGPGLPYFMFLISSIIVLYIFIFLIKLSTLE
ncbi:MAG: hypothetical protein EU536_03830 [Promethearchaeota archaeon]|nr:MAG: hypothetical protein EU536_03830 [Candidatus Lokiarchaeota archaeon]